jgi:hypothetical protein
MWHLSPRTVGSVCWYNMCWSSTSGHLQHFIECNDIAEKLLIWWINRDVQQSLTYHIDCSILMIRSWTIMIWIFNVEILVMIYCGHLMKIELTWMCEMSNKLFSTDLYTPILRSSWSIVVFWFIHVCSPWVAVLTFGFASGQNRYPRTNK